MYMYAILAKFMISCMHIDNSMYVYVVSTCMIAEYSYLDIISPNEWLYYIHNDIYIYT